MEVTSPRAAGDDDPGGDGGSGGQPGTGGTGGAAKTPLACEVDHVGLDGQVASAPLSALYPRAQEFLWYPLSPPFQLGVDFGEPVPAPGAGFLRLHADAFFESSTGEMSGWLRLPGGSSAPIYCATASVTRLDEFSLDFQTTSLHELGACGGTPLAGEVTACAGPPDFCGGDPLFVSTISGAETSESFQTYNTVGTTDAEYLPLRYLKLGPDWLITAIETWFDGGAVAEALVTMPSGPDAGAIYCAGAGSTVATDPTGAHAKVALKNLTRLGKCEPTAGHSAGSLSGCVR